MTPALLALTLALADPPVQPPPFLEGLFPCTRCHDGKALVTDTRRRELDFHQSIVLNHLGPQAWCFSCHDPKGRDRLHLASGEGVPFTASHRLCGQCHAEAARAWAEGRHHDRRARKDAPLPLCVACHNPHSAILKPH